MSARVSSARFIGRESELAELERALRDASEGRPSLVLVAGESGVGKSRLLRELQSQADGGGVRVLGGECIELGGEEVPYAALAAAIRPLARGGDPVFERLTEAARCDLSRLAPELGRPPAEPGAEGREEAQRQLFDALGAMLAALAEDEPVLLWLEDLHWADRSTRAFVVYLARTLRSERVLVVATYRSDELRRRHPLRPLLAELERAPSTRRVELARFDREEVRVQLADIIGGEPGEEVLERLFSRSEGNPLFSEELIAAGVDGRGAPPPTLRDALLLRTEQLSEEAQRQLRLVAVAGRADDALLAELTPAGTEAARAALREAVAANVLSAGDDGALGFRHALLREVVYDDLLPGERAELHLEVGRALERREDDARWRMAAIAHHFHAAEAQPDALRTAVAAAADAERVNAFGEAAAMLDRALSLWPRVEHAAELAGRDHVALLVAASRAHVLAREETRGVSLLASAAEELDPEREPLRLASVLGELASGQWSLGQGEQARATLRRALELAGSEPSAQRAQVLAYVVRIRLLQGRFRELEEVAEDALATADALGLESVRASVLHRLGHAIFVAGDYERGEVIMREGLEVARRHGSKDELGTAYSNYADALNIAGRADESQALVDRALEEIPSGARTWRWLTLMEVELALDRGDWGRAEELLPPDLGRLEANMTQVNMDLLRARLALGIGKLERARELLDAADDLLCDSVEPQFLAPAAALRAELEIRSGDVEAARAAVDRGLDRLQFCTEDLERLAQVAAAGTAVEAEAAVAARDRGEKTAEAEAIERARAALERVAIAVEEVPHPLAQARLATSRAAMAHAEGAEEEADLWRAAAAQWGEMGRPYPRAHARLREAEARLARRDRAAAAEAASEAHALAARIGSRWLVEELDSFAARARLKLDADGASTAGVAEEPAERPFGLTERELQVLELVATGATNREIGEQLFMAEKTASVHVSRILAKLDVRGRTEAAALAHRQGLVAGPQG